MHTSLHNLFDKSKQFVCSNNQSPNVNFLFMGNEAVFERIQSVLKERQIDHLAFQKALNLRSQDWTHWRNRAVPKKWIFPVAEYLGIYSDWLATGNGPQYKAAPPPPAAPLAEGDVDPDPVTTYITRVVRIAGGLMAADDYNYSEAEQLAVYRSCMDLNKSITISDADLLAKIKKILAAV